MLNHENNESLRKTAQNADESNVSGKGEDNDVAKFYDSIQKSIHEQVTKCIAKSLSCIAELERENDRLQEKIRELQVEKWEEKNASEATIKELKEEVTKLREKSNACFLCGKEANALLFCSEDCKERVVL